MLQEVPVVCPRCERKRVERVVPGVCEIRHSGHYELMCKDCVTIVIGEHVLAHGPQRAVTIKPEMTDEVPLFNIIGAMTRRTKVGFENLKLMNEQQ